MSTIALRPIDQTNYLDCFHLRLAPGQEKYVSEPIRSLAQAYVYYRQCTPFGVYADETMVGYLMVIYDDEEKTYNIWHVMIDQQYQRQGYGRQAVLRALDYAAARPFGASDTVLITCNPDNAGAYELYKKLGFRETGRDDDEENELAYSLPAAPQRDAAKDGGAERPRLPLAADPMLTPRQARQKSPLALAFLGDTVWDLLVRRSLLLSGHKAGALHRQAILLVNANAQSQVSQRLEPLLTEDELDILRRGRNAHARHEAPKNQDPADYSRASGLEALFGYLYLTGQTERICQLFDMSHVIP